MRFFEKTALICILIAIGLCAGCTNTPTETAVSTQPTTVQQTTSTPTIIQTTAMTPEITQTPTTGPTIPTSIPTTSQTVAPTQNPNDDEKFKTIISNSAENRTILLYTYPSSISDIAKTNNYYSLQQKAAEMYNHANFMIGQVKYLKVSEKLQPVQDQYVSGLEAARLYANQIQSGAEAEIKSGSQYSATARAFYTNAVANLDIARNEVNGAVQKLLTL